VSGSALNSAYLAIDLGAESGRALLGRLQNGILTLDEIHRFPNEPVREGGSLRWNVHDLWAEIQQALTRVSEVKLDGIGVDAWGVDYALLDQHGELLENPYHYRDSRTNGVMDDVFRIVPKEEIYSATGIQFMPINTLFQLYAHQRDDAAKLAKARSILTIPDLFHYWLTGRAACEYTNATTTQLVNPAARSWSKDLMRRLGLPSDLPAEIIEPGEIVGDYAGTPVIAPASHDTASAVASISTRGDTAFLSSGTWSLVGTELDAPVINSETLAANFTNEGGAKRTTMLLKNVMGLWMLQGCRRAWAAQGNNYAYAELMEAAAEAPAFRTLVNPDDPRFLNPPHMPTAIGDFCSESAQSPPAGAGAFGRCILESLALKYALVIHDLERVTHQPVRRIRVIGGGSKNRLLNQFTADATGKQVVAGPAEATALGNIAVQMAATGRAASLEDARATIDRSFPVEIFEPRDTDAWASYFTVIMTDAMWRSHSN
jgi:rhamnulokinase